MKIGIDIRTLMDARFSGVSEYTFNLVREILKLDTENKYQLFYNSFKNLHGIARSLTQKNMEVIQWRWPNKILNYFLFKLFNWPKVDKRLGVDTFFVPHINFIGLSKSSAVKKILTIHDLSFLRYPEFFSCRKNFWHKMINIRKLVNKFDIVVAVSENTKQDIVKLCGVEPEKVRVIYSGVGPEYKKLQITNYKLQINSKSQSLNLNEEEKKVLQVKLKYNLPDKFILFLGTLEPRKNIEGLIEAYSKLRSTNYPRDSLRDLKPAGELRNIKLVVAGGKGWKGENIYKAWKKSPFKDDIIFTGYVDRENKPYLYNLASVFVYPSFYEGFGFPPLEAMACGVPVITSATSSLSEVVGDAGIMIDPYNITDIARAIEQVLSDEELRNSLIERGLEKAKQFNWKKTAREYLDLWL